MSNDYTPKYDVHRADPEYPGKPGRKERPKTWQRDRYYALLKHRAQARFRGEEHSLTEEEWNDVWDEASWSQRGRSPQDLALFRKDPQGPWSRPNTVVDQNQNKARYYHPQRDYGGRPKGSPNRRKSQRNITSSVSQI